jgi:hypothetical protein
LIIKDIPVKRSFRFGAAHVFRSALEQTAEYGRPNCEEANFRAGIETCLRKAIARFGGIGDVAGRAQVIHLVLL